VNAAVNTAAFDVLVDASPTPPVSEAHQALLQAVAALDPDALTPKQALEALYALKLL
jgi:DNA mismatch repair protein MutS